MRGSGEQVGHDGVLVAHEELADAADFGLAQDVAVERYAFQESSCLPAVQPVRASSDVLLRKKGAGQEGVGVLGEELLAEDVAGERGEIGRLQVRRVRVGSLPVDDRSEERRVGKECRL